MFDPFGYNRGVAYRRGPLSPGGIASANLSSPARRGPASANIPAGSGGDSGGQAFGGTTGGVATGGGFGGAVDPAVAEQAARAEALREQVLSRRGRANALFEALTGAVRGMAKAQRGEFEEGIAKQEGMARTDFQESVPGINRTYGGRGLLDSSYRVNAIDAAANALDRALAELGEERESGLARIGREAETELAAIGADRSSIADLNLGEIGDDASQLVSLRNKLDDLIRTATQRRSTLRSSEGFRGRLNQIAPSGKATGALRQSLSNLAQAAIPQSVKNRVAEAVINTYIGDSNDADKWRRFFQEQQAAPQAVEAVAEV